MSTSEAAPDNEELIALRRALASAKEELRQRDDFLAVVTHELRNPLAPLAFAIDLLLNDAIRGCVPAPDVLVRRLKLLHRQIGRLTTDLNRLLDFSRIRSGRLELRPADVDLHEIVGEVLQEMKPQFDSSLCEVRLSSAGPQWGRWDPMRLRQVLWNLLSNAAKFGAGAPIEVALTGSEHDVCLSVRDRGPGIAEHERERVFNRFERAGTGNLHVGFGVGLWLVKQIVDALGGHVQLESEVGCGATFIVTLPRYHHG
jgi:two-component system, OmpR family, sensor kinase